MLVGFAHFCHRMFVEHANNEASGDLIYSVNTDGFGGRLMRHTSQEVMVPFVGDDKLLFL